jgi:DNA processing protein
MSAAQEALARVALNQVVEPGRPGLLRWVAAEGAVRVRDELLALGDESAEHRLVAQRLGAVDAAAVLDRAHRLGLRWVVPGDPEWPASLADLDHVDPLHERTGVPLGLWVKGPLRLDAIPRSVAVVGARSATAYGVHVAGEIGCALAEAGWGVVSGAAIGIDQAAHRGALAGDGPTVAVLACGADRIYPKNHEALFGHLARHGAIVSEAAPGWAPIKIRFLARNRLIAALTRGTVVVEAAARSGALNTSTWADRLSRPLMGVPGPVTSPLSQGVHQLVRRGAALVTCGAEVLEHLGAAGEHVLEEDRGPARVGDDLGPLDRQVLEAVPVSRPAAVESIARVAGLDSSQVVSALHTLLDRELVVRTEHGWRLGAASADRPPAFLDSRG